MGWKKARFKDKDVWVEVDAAGGPAARSGRVAMRYSKDEGARIYRASVANLALAATATVEELPAGDESEVPKPAAGAPAAKASRGSGFGSAGSRTQAQTAAAAASAKQQIGGLPEGTIIAFTDGSCRGNPGPAGSGAYVQLPDGRKGEWARSLGRGTNNIAELTAIEMALELLDEADVPPNTPVALFSDSSYARGVLALGWKAKANQDLIRQIRGKLALRPGVALHWVAGHAGVAGNERADALANAGVAGRNERRWV